MKGVYMDYAHLGEFVALLLTCWSKHKDVEFDSEDRQYAAALVAEILLDMNDRVQFEKSVTRDLQEL